jgi:exodeoxyribonuclease-3
MKIITWNIQHGGGKRISSILKVLELNSDCDVLIITEFRTNSNGQKIQDTLSSLGFRYSAYPETDSNKNKVFIASKIEFSSNHFPQLMEHEHRIIEILFEETSIGGGKLKIYGCYFPQKDEKKYLFEHLIREISRTECDVMILGDLNTGKHKIDELGETFYQSNYMDAFENYRMTDVFRHLHGEKREYSWFSSFGNGFRIDHIFVSSGLKKHIKDCYYTHCHREEKFSDHSMMTLELVD